MSAYRPRYMNKYNFYRQQLCLIQAEVEMNRQLSKGVYTIPLLRYQRN
jgi:hypothetical protein